MEYCFTVIYIVSNDYLKHNSFIFKFSSEGVILQELGLEMFF